MDRKVILVSILPIANIFNLFPQTEIINEKKKINYEKRKDLLELLNKEDYYQEFKKELENSVDHSLTLINYPKNKKQLESFDEILKEKVIKFILISISDYDLIVKIRENYLICPFCEKSYLRSNSIKEENFVCPKDSEYKFSLKKIESFNEEFIRSFLTENKEIIDFFNNKLQTNFFKIDISEKEIDSPEILSEKIFKLIKEN